MFSTELFKTKPYRLGLTLSGGGAKCMAQIGLLQYLKEQGIAPDIVAGTSGGAMVGALYCAGYEPDEILEFFISTKMFSLRNLSFNSLGLIDSEKAAKNLAPYFREDRFEALKKPLHVVATDLNRAQQVVFNSGPLINALAASSAYPGMFTPLTWNNTVYADGGIINNYPADLINDQCRHHIGMYLSPIVSRPSEHFENTFDVLDRVFQIFSSARQFSNISLPEISLAPEGIEDCSAFMVKPDQLKSIYDMGYSASKKHFESEGALWLEKMQGVDKKKSSWFKFPLTSNFD
ncbi:patatin-like phospholipase family protein [Endozoicomonas ascidiicola]|uniref:patatin-like phospholipase family protein n=1 Tax=Endozoicomonas ascidiicola TaxID=1698521 RepID=UPI00082BFA98|nr:patatin-like phospholipase family protein [Endozoicomonas ascidiicola]